MAAPRPAGSDGTSRGSPSSGPGDSSSCGGGLFRTFGWSGDVAAQPRGGGGGNGGGNGGDEPASSRMGAAIAKWKKRLRIHAEEKGSGSSLTTLGGGGTEQPTNAVRPTAASKSSQESGCSRGSRDRLAAPSVELTEAPPQEREEAGDDCAAQRLQPSEEGMLKAMPLPALEQEAPGEQQQAASANVLPGTADAQVESHQVEGHDDIAAQDSPAQDGFSSATWDGAEVALEQPAAPVQQPQASALGDYLDSHLRLHNAGTTIGGDEAQIPPSCDVASDGNQLDEESVPAAEETNGGLQAAKGLWREFSLSVSPLTIPDDMDHRNAPGVVDGLGEAGWQAGSSGIRAEAVPLRSMPTLAPDLFGALAAVVAPESAAQGTVRRQRRRHSLSGLVGKRTAFSSVPSSPRHPSSQNLDTSGQDGPITNHWHGELGAYDAERLEKERKKPVDNGRQHHNSRKHGARGNRSASSVVFSLAGDTQSPLFSPAGSPSFSPTNSQLSPKLGRLAVPNTSFSGPLPTSFMNLDQMRSRPDHPVEMLLPPQPSIGPAGISHSGPLISSVDPLDLMGNGTHGSAVSHYHPAEALDLIGKGTYSSATTTTPLSLKASAANEGGKQEKAAASKTPRHRRTTSSEAIRRSPTNSVVFLAPCEYGGPDAVSDSRPSTSDSSISRGNPIADGLWAM